MRHDDPRFCRVRHAFNGKTFFEVDDRDYFSAKVANPLTNGGMFGTTVMVVARTIPHLRGRYRVLRQGRRGPTDSIAFAIAVFLFAEKFTSCITVALQRRSTTIHRPLQLGRGLLFILAGNFTKTQPPAPGVIETRCLHHARARFFAPNSTRSRACSSSW